jgi:hypothetical protein
MGEKCIQFPLELGWNIGGAQVENECFPATAGMFGQLENGSRRDSEEKGLQKMMESELIFLILSALINFFKNFYRRIIIFSSFNGSNIYRSFQQISRENLGSGKVGTECAEKNMRIKATVFSYIYCIYYLYDTYLN